MMRLGGNVSAPPPDKQAWPGREARRLFFALWPDQAGRERLAHNVRGAVRASGGRPVASDQLHLTLAFLGSVPETRVVELAALAAELIGTANGALGPIALSFERLAHWPGPRVLCALPERTPAALDQLVKRLLKALTAADFTPDLKPFRPHVTVARKVLRSSRSAALRAVHWRFEAFALIASRTLESGPVYSVVGTYPLGSEAQARK